MSEGGDEIHCGVVGLSFPVGANVKRMLPYVDEHARGLVPGSRCSEGGYGSLSYPLEGFHPTDYGNGIWRWEIRVTDQYDNGLPECDMRLDLVINSSSEDNLSEISLENENDPSCANPSFL